MDLVECLECDAEIWDNADKCHECGTPNPSVSDRKLIEDMDNMLHSSTVIPLLFFGFILAIIIAVVLAFG
jgi:hypothetical protein